MPVTDCFSPFQIPITIIFPPGTEKQMARIDTLPIVTRMTNTPTYRVTLIDPMRQSMCQERPTVIANDPIARCMYRAYP